jgi:hypothetical protein
VGCEPPVFEIEEEPPLTKKLRLMIGFNLEPSLHKLGSDPAHQILPGHFLQSHGAKVQSAILAA